MDVNNESLDFYNMDFSSISNSNEFQIKSSCYKKFNSLSLRQSLSKLKELQSINHQKISNNTAINNKKGNDINYYEANKNICFEFNLIEDCHNFLKNKNEAEKPSGKFSIIHIINIFVDLSLFVYFIKFGFILIDIFEVKDSKIYIYKLINK